MTDKLQDIKDYCKYYDYLDFVNLTDLNWLIEQAEKVELLEKAIQEFEKEYAYEYSFQIANARGRSQWQKGALRGFEHIKEIFDKHFK